MVIFIRTAVAMPGKIPQLMIYAKEMQALIKKVIGVEVAVGLRLGGNAAEVCWSANYDSLAQVQDVSTKLMTDAAYVAQLGKGADLIVAESVHDQIWLGF